MSIRTAGIIVVGNEILGGSVKDENVQFLCRRFHELGVRVEKVVVVGDIIQDIAEEVLEFSGLFDLVITSGGLGPTHDDVTYEGIARAFGLELELNEELHCFWKRDAFENEVSARKMSVVPKSSKIIYAEISKEEKTPVVLVSNVYIFPGTPQLLKSRFTALEKQCFDGYGTKFYKKEIYLLEDETAILLELNRTVSLYRDVDIGSYPVIDSHYYQTRITLNSHEEHKVIEAYNMLLSLIDPSWIVDPKKLPSNL